METINKHINIINTREAETFSLSFFKYVPQIFYITNRLLLSSITTLSCNNFTICCLDAGIVSDNASDGAALFSNDDFDSYLV